MTDLYVLQSLQSILVIDIIMSKTIILTSSKKSIKSKSKPKTSKKTRIWFENGLGRGVWFEEPNVYKSLKIAKATVDQDQLPKDSYSSDDLRTRIAFVVGPKTAVQSIFIYEYDQQFNKRGKQVAKQVYYHPKRISFIENKLAELSSSSSQLSS